MDRTVTAPAPSGPPLDPRAAVVLAEFGWNIDDDGAIIPDNRTILPLLDAADRAAGVVRVDTTSEVLRAMLVQAVRDCWMSGKPFAVDRTINFDAFGDALLAALRETPIPPSGERG